MTKRLHTVVPLNAEELALLHGMRAARRRGKTLHPAHLAPPGRGDRIADAVAALVGSWPFIIVQSGLLAAWMALNVTAWVQAWDPYPFILLNLVLSFQAAYAAPFIMMSQNRQAMIDRADAKNDYDVNRKAELEIELLHEKVDLLRATEVAELIRIIRGLEERIGALTGKAGA